MMYYPADSCDISPSAFLLELCLPHPSPKISPLNSCFRVWKRESRFKNPTSHCSSFTLLYTCMYRIGLFQGICIVQNFLHRTPTEICQIFEGYFSDQVYVKSMRSRPGTSPCKIVFGSQLQVGCKGHHTT